MKIQITDQTIKSYSC